MSDSDGDRDPKDGVPWGRRPVAGIPVPPFSEPGEHRAFLLALAEHVALTAGAAGPIDAATFALTTALSDARSRTGDATEPQPWVLLVATSTYFPAPWTPQGLAEALDASGVTPGRSWYHRHDEVGYYADPELHAKRDRAGRWVARFRERGVDRLAAELHGDDDMVLYLMSLTRGNPYPFGWAPADQARLDALAATAGPTLAAWRSHATLPYLATWSARPDGA